MIERVMKPGTPLCLIGDRRSWMDACGTRRLVEVPGLCDDTPLVAVVEAAESGQRDDLGVSNGPGLPWAVRGCGLGEAEVVRSSW